MFGPFLHTAICRRRRFSVLFFSFRERPTVAPTAPLCLFLLLSWWWWWWWLLFLLLLSVKNGETTTRILPSLSLSTFPSVFLSVLLILWLSARPASAKASSRRQHHAKLPPHSPPTSYIVPSVFLKQQQQRTNPVRIGTKWLERSIVTQPNAAGSLQVLGVEITAAIERREPCDHFLQPIGQNKK